MSSQRPRRRSTMRGGLRERRDGLGPGWDVISIRVILTNEIYRGVVVWNRSRWRKDPQTRRRRRIDRPASEWVRTERPELCIVDEALWRRVAERRARIRSLFTERSTFGRSRVEYGKYLLSGLLVCERLAGLRTFIERGDTSASVRAWLTAAERYAESIAGNSAALATEWSMFTRQRSNPICLN